MAISGVAGQSQLAAYQRSGTGTLTPEQQQEVNRLKAIDRKVRAHEQAHMAVGAGLTGGASFQFTRGPDGRQYAVAGEVTINLSSGQTPESTIDRARQIQAAALAPADPSAQDRAVAAAAAAMESQARAELSRLRRDEQMAGTSPSTGPAPDSPRQAAGLRAYSQAAEGAGDSPVSGRIDQYA